MSKSFFDLVVRPTAFGVGFLTGFAILHLLGVPITDFDRGAAFGTVATRYVMGLLL